MAQSDAEPGCVRCVSLTIFLELFGGLPLVRLFCCNLNFCSSEDVEMNLKIAILYVRNSTPLVFFIIFAIGPRSLQAATVWNGPTVSFTKLGFADWTQPQNQDRITTNVWITRGNSQGPINAKTESLFTHLLSPADTQWASGQLGDYATLTYSDWDTWAAHFPPGTVGVDAVVHLVTDDIYLSLKFTSWAGGNSGGGFSYDRSTFGSGPPAPPPAPTITGSAMANDGTFSITFTNMPGNTFSVLAATNIALPLASWTVLGPATEVLAGSGKYQYVDAGAGTNSEQRHYVIRWP